MKQLRIYLDTSVFGGCFDDEFAGPSRRLIEEIKLGRYVLVVSSTNLEELRRAPEQVRQLLKDLLRNTKEFFHLTDEVATLRDAYLESGVIRSEGFFDAEHIAFATVAKVDLIVSWNFKHIVNFHKIRGYHAVNILNGYPTIPIHSPLEVTQNDE